MANISPTTAILESMRKQSLAWHTILGELIDNAFDAAANRIAISFSGQQLEVADDGVGCKNLLLLVTPGARENKHSTRLGRYGIGAKDAAISAADAVSIVSVHKGIKRAVVCNWKALEKKGDWNIADPDEAPTQDQSGTRIILSPLRSERLQRPDDLVCRLSLHYTPAIRLGRQIVFKASKQAAARPIPEYHFPTLEHQTTKELTVDGKVASVVLGLVPDGCAFPERGFVVTYGYRVIKKGEMAGLGDEPPPGLFGWIDLGEGWELTKNKDNISSNFDALAVAINAAFRDVLDKAASRSQFIQFRNVSREINQVLKDLSGEQRRKAKRGPKSNEGLVLPKGSGRRHKRASRSQPGDTFSEALARARGLAINFDRFGEGGPAWKYSGNTVSLNVDIPAITVDRSDERSLTRHAVYAVATYIAHNDGMFPVFQDCDTVWEKASMIAGHLLARLSQQPPTLADAS